MIWLTWRQFRIQTWIVLGAVGVLGVLLLLTGRSIAEEWTNAGLDACGTDCSNAMDSFMREIREGAPGALYGFVNALLYVTPALIGIFWGAPLIARELETGTHRLVWNQSITRTRWLASKLLLIGAAVAATTGVLSWAVTVWADRIDEANGDRIMPLTYGARGIVPIGYALFGFMLGVVAGMLIRRAVAAMAATLGIYAAAVGAMATGGRAQLVPAVRDTPALNTETLMGIGMDPATGEMRIQGADVADGWVLSNETITPTGEVFRGPADERYCGPNTGFDECQEWLLGFDLRQEIIYHPASHFWSLQWAETGVFVAAALVLAGFSFWWARRRLA